MSSLPVSSAGLIEPTDTDRRKKRLTKLAILVGSSGPVAVIIATAVSTPMAFGVIPYSVVNFTLVSLVYLVVAVWAGCFLAVAAASPPTRSRSVTWTRVTMTMLALLAPIGLVVAIRLSFEACILLNPLLLPWPEPLRTIARVVSAVVVLGSSALIIRGLRSRDLRPTSVALVICSACFSIPTFFFLFLTVYGDPGPNCIVG